MNGLVSVERLQEAIADNSNLAENAEYQAAKSEQEINEARIAELGDKLARADVIDISELSGDTIKFGATVSLIEEDTGEYERWQDRFSGQDYAFGKEPNYFLKSCKQLLPRSGRALAVADGKGRRFFGSLSRG